MATEGRPSLAVVEIKNFQGLYTKSSPDILEPEQLDIAQNIDFVNLYGAAAKIKGNARILSSADPAAITWVGFYKASSLNGSILRHVLVANGTKISLLEGSSLTTLKTGRTAGLYYTADRMGRLMFISNQNPDLIGNGDDMVKYDGDGITNWGLLAPGSTETVIQDFNSAGVFTATNCTLTNESTTTWDGASVKITQNSVTSTFYFDASYGTAFGIDTTTADRAALYVYIPRGEYTKFSTDGLSGSPAIQVFFGSDNNLATNWYRFDFTIGRLAEGWNRLTFDFRQAPDNDPTTTAQDGASSGTLDPASINYMRWQFNPKTTNTEAIVAFMDRNVTMDQGAPVPAASVTAGNPNGSYTYKVTYVSRFGHESNAGPASPAVTVSSKQIDLTEIPVSPDEQTVARRIYRTVASGTVYLLLTTIYDNSTTTYTDNTADGSLSQIQPPTAGSFSNDNSPPPKAGIVRVWKRTVFLAGDPQNPDTLYFSTDDEPESFPIVNSFELDGKITAIYETYSGLVVETENGKWQVVGDNPDFAVDKIIEGMGCVGRRAAGTGKLLGWSVDRDGMRLFDLSDIRKISEPIRDKYDALNQTNIELIHTVHSKKNNMILQFNPNASGNYTSIFAYQYAIDEIRNGWWTEIVTASGANLNFLDAEEIEDSNGDVHLYAGASDGMLYELFAEDSHSWVDVNGTKYAIDSKLRTHYIRIGDEARPETEGGLSGRTHPRHVEVRVVGDACNWTVTCDTASGPRQPTATSTWSATFDYAANDTLKRFPTRNLQPGEFVRFTAQNNELDIDSILLAIRTYVHVRPGQFVRD